MATAAQTFFNLPAQGSMNDADFFGSPPQHSLQTNWRTFHDQPVTADSVIDLFANRVPVLREKGLLSAEECDKMLQIVNTHELGSYDTETTWPRVGVSGITQYDHIKDKNAYFDSTEAAYSLQRRWRDEAGVDVLARVASKLQDATGMTVEVAREEGDREYFAGILRAVDAGMHVHADYAPYEAVGWSISKSAAQLTWNILLNQVPGGDTLIYDRQWRAPDDDVAWRKEFPKDSYQPQMLEGRPFKAMQAVPGDLTFFNPR
ncbi:signal transduction protein [Apiospora marii]|uniref:Signal transduction protein n=1 Tax=Apiospora marii TaxID=335849 RepID=A0ABR1R589_9PEZI